MAASTIYFSVCPYIYPCKHPVAVLPSPQESFYGMKWREYTCIETRYINIYIYTHIYLGSKCLASAASLGSPYSQLLGNFVSHIVLDELEPSEETTASPSLLFPVRAEVNGPISARGAKG
jgi:hypothetical protein